MARRPALAVAFALALVLTTGAFAAAANYGLLTRTKSDSVGRLNATNVAELSPPSVDSPASSEPASTVAVDEPSQAAPVDGSAEVAPAAPTVETGQADGAGRPSEPGPTPSATPPVRDFSWLEGDGGGAQDGSAGSTSSAGPWPAPPDRGVTTTSVARPPTTPTTARHDEDDDRGEDQHPDEDHDQDQDQDQDQDHAEEQERDD